MATQSIPIKKLCRHKALARHTVGVRATADVFHTRQIKRHCNEFFDRCGLPRNGFTDFNQTGQPH